MDHPSTTEAKTANVLQAKIDAPLIFRFPVAMFDPDSTLLYMAERSRFVRGMVELYDNMAEQCRVRLNEADGGDRKPLPKLGLAIIDTSAVEKAAEPNDDIEGAPA